MTKSRAIEMLLGLSLLTAGLGVGWMKVGEPASKSAAGDIRFVDLNQVLDQFTKKGALIQQIEQRVEDLRSVFETQQEKVNLIESDIQASPRGSREWIELNNQLELEKIKLRQIRDNTEREITRMEAAALVSSYKEIRKAVETYRAKNDFGAVLIVDNTEIPPELAATDRETVGQYVNLRPVVAWDPALDITQTIIKMLNQ
ncbi:MAG: OmpH family outer membrane protein [Planctomycetota bacterium]